MNKKRNLANIFNKYLVLDLWTEILARLPLRSLIQLRLVCKDWNSLITSHAFHMLHLCLFDANCEFKFLLSLENETSLKERVVRLNKSFRKIDDSKLLISKGWDCIKGDFLGYVDGLVIMHKRYRCPEINQICLWNPSFPRSIIIPKPFANWKSINVGFGFDNLLNDYKVVVVYMECPYVIRYMSYHLRHESLWSSEKKAKCPSPKDELYMQPLSWMTNYEGGVYWICYDNVDMNCGLSRILRFDLSSEGYSCVSLPQDEYKIGKNPVDFRRLSVMNTSLTVLDCHYMEHISVWVLGKDDTIDTWTKLYNVDLPLYECLVLKSNAELLFLECRKGVVSCDLKSVKKTIKYVSNAHTQPIHFIRAYEESMVLFKEFTRMGEHRSKNRGKPGR